MPSGQQQTTKTNAPAEVLSDRTKKELQRLREQVKALGADVKSLAEQEARDRWTAIEARWQAIEEQVEAKKDEALREVKKLTEDVRGRMEKLRDTLKTTATRASEDIEAAFLKEKKSAASEASKPATDKKPTARA